MTFLVGVKIGVEYNECLYKPFGWQQAYRFVAMREPKEKTQEDIQLELLEATKYIHRIFVTSLTTRPHKVIKNMTSEQIVKIL